MLVQSGAEILRSIIIRNRSTAALAGPPGVGKSQIGAFDVLISIKHS